MKRNRKILIDKKYQLKMAATFTAFAAIAVSAFIAILAYTSYKYSYDLEIVAANQKEISSQQDEVFKTLLALSSSKNLNNFRVSRSELKQDMALNKSKLDESISIIHQININNYRLVFILVSLLLLQSMVMFYLIIKRSHRTSGPVFILNRYINEIKNGKYPDIRPLRDKDDFTELFDNFREMVDKLKTESK